MRRILSKWWFKSFSQTSQYESVCFTGTSHCCFISDHIFLESSWQNIPTKLNWAFLPTDDIYFPYSVAFRNHVIISYQTHMLTQIRFIQHKVIQIQRIRFIQHKVIQIQSRPCYRYINTTRNNIVTETERPPERQTRCVGLSKGSSLLRSIP